MIVEFRVVLALALGVGALLGSAYLEGTALSVLIAGPTAVLVLGGTVAACLLHSPPGAWAPALRLALKALGRGTAAPDRRDDFVRWAGLARREGYLSLEPLVEREQDPVVRLGLRHLLDGGGKGRLKDTLTEAVEYRVAPLEEAAGLFEAAGGYAPTMGVLGAVLGLVHALQQLQDPAAMGPGVAAAFVATLYGLALANLLLLPIAGRLRLLAEQRRRAALELVEGLLGLSRLEHPQRLAERLAGPRQAQA